MTGTWYCYWSTRSGSLCSFTIKAADRQRG